MQIKLQLNKLRLDRPLINIIQHQQQTNGIAVLPVQLKHVLALPQLPQYHKDPFDRLLLAHAQVEGTPLLTADPIMATYPVNVVI